MEVVLNLILCLNQREAEKGFGDNVPKQGMGRQSHRIPVPVPERSKK